MLTGRDPCFANVQFGKFLCFSLAGFVQFVKRGSTHVEMPSFKFIDKRLNSAYFQVRFAQTCIKSNNENIHNNL